MAVIEEFNISWSRPDSETYDVRFHATSIGSVTVHYDTARVVFKPDTDALVTDKRVYFFSTIEEFNEFLPTLNVPRNRS